MADREGGGSRTPEAGDDLTLREAAELLGVHYMTAYRHVRTGRLPAHRVGGEWRIARRDLAADGGGDGSARGGRASGTRASGGMGSGGTGSGGSGSGSTGSSGTGSSGTGSSGAAGSSAGRTRHRRGPATRARLAARLTAGDEAGAWSVVQSALVDGYEPVDVHLSLLGPAMADIGDRWAAGELDVAHEHRATAVAQRLVGRLGPRFVRPGRRRGTVVVACAPGDHHDLATALAADVVRSAGYDVVDLGGDTPVASLVAAACRADRLVAVCVTVAIATALTELGGLIAALGTALPGVPVLVGGPAVDGTPVAGVPASSMLAGDASRLVTALSGLPAR